MSASPVGANIPSFPPDIERTGSLTADEVLSLHGQIYYDDPPRNDNFQKRRWKSTATIFTGVSKAQRVRTRDFLMGLAKAFAKYGAPSHRIEYQLELVALALEQPGSFVVIPGEYLTDTTILMWRKTEYHSPRGHMDLFR